MELPSGSRTIEDQAIIECLLKDESFRQSMEEKIGKIGRIWADWPADRLFYEKYDGDLAWSILSKLIKKLREIDYIKEFLN